MVMAPRERFELPRSKTSGFRDRRHTGLGYLGSSIRTRLVIFQGFQSDVIKMKSHMDIRFK